MKKIYPILIIVLLVNICFLWAETFEIDYHLPGTISFQGKNLDFYNYKNFSIAEYANYSFSGISQETKFQLDYDNKQIILTPVVSERDSIQIFPSVIISMDKYYQLSFEELFYENLRKEVQQQFDSEERTEGQGLIPEIVINLPKIAQTRTVRRLLGNKAGRLSLNGSQKVTLQGGTNYNSSRDSEKDNSKDWQMKVRQDLILQLRGTVGEKIHVDVNHRSTSKDDILSEPSEVNIRYEGTEDEIVKTIDGGNISLNLSGSNYITYNASSKGLFGIKSEMEIGDLSITTIMGQDQAKQDTKTYSNSAESDSTTVYSKAYAQRSIYYVTEPEELYQIYAEGDQFLIGNQWHNIPPGWADNAIKTDADGRWILANTAPLFLPDEDAELTLYVDNHIGSDNTLTLSGVEWDDPDYSWDDNNDTEYDFDILIEGTDYVVDYDTGLIYLNSNLDKRYSLGITYTSVSGKQYGNPAANPVEVKLLRKTNQDKIDNLHYWKLQARNIYSMGLEGIKADGFGLNVYHENEADGTFEYTVPDTINFEVLPGDGKYYNDYLRLDADNDHSVTADDNTINLEAGTITFPFIEPFRPLGDAEIYDEEGDSVPQKDTKMRMMVKGEIGRNSIDLGMNIMPGSVVVKLGPDKTKLVEGVDYIVDYDFGDLTMLSERAKDTSKEIFIDYQYKPIFAIDSKTIMGIRADWDISDNFKLGSTFIYQSEKVKEDHPKIGNENRTVILTDIDGEISYKIPFITRAIDWLPLIRTDAESSISLGAEAAMSLTKIYGSDKQSDKKEAYLEDMEAILDTYPLGINRDSWVPASKPYHVYNYGRAIPNWFNPEEVRAEEVYIPETLASDERNDIIQILALRMKPTNLSNPGMQNLYWSGLMKYIGNEIDYSEKKYIELLVKVNEDHETLEKPYVKMHIDLGDVSEDFYTDFGGLGVLNKEERSETGLFKDAQDIGLDGIPDGELGDDPNDNYDSDVVMVYGEEEYPHINGTENNLNELDTEDLNDNGVLNTAEIFYEYSVDLGRDEYLESEYNGWRLYRIPLHGDDNFQKISNNANKEPNLEKISFARIWFEIEQECKVKLVNLDIVGNKWIEEPITTDFSSVVSDIELDNNDEIVSVGIVDNQKNPHYMPAPGTVIEKTGESSLEQSLVLTYQNLQAGHRGYATQEFIDKYSLLGYERIRFWVYAEEMEDYLADYDPQTLVIRIGANETNYYEIRKPIVIRDYNADVDNEMNPIMKSKYWNDEDNPQIDIKLSDLTFLKNELDETIIDMGNYLYYEKNGYEFRRIGNPTLSNIKEISLGLEANELFNGTVYFDDIRVANPFEEPGYAGFVDFSTSLADFIGFNANMEVKSENFNTSTERKKNYSYDSENNFNISGNIGLHKFFPNQWGLSMPVVLTRSQSLKLSRFKANSDILRENLSKEDKEREQTKSLLYRGSFNFSQNQKPNSKIVEYLVKNTKLEANIQKRFSSTPTSADSTLTYSAKHTYTMSYNKDDVELKVWNSFWNKWFNTNHKIYFFPTSISNTINYNVEYPERWTWRTATDTISHWELSTNNDTIKTVTTSSSINFPITSNLDLSYSLNTNRDMLKENYFEDFNIGTEKTRTQKIDLDYDPKLTDGILAMSFSASADYNDRRIESNTTTDSLRTYYYDGGVTRNFSSDFDLKNRDLLENFRDWLDSKIERKQENTKPEEKESENKPDEIKDEPKDKPEVEKPKESESKPKSSGNISEDKEKPIIGKGEEESEEKPNERAERENSGRTGNNRNRRNGRSNEPSKSDPNAPLVVKFVDYLTRLDNISFDYSNTYKTKFEDLEERPDIWYQLGKPDVLRAEADTLWAEDGSILEILPEQLSLNSITHRITASTNLVIFRNLTTGWNFSWDNNRNLSSDKETRKIVFPNVSITLTEFEKLIRMEDILTSSRLTSSYSKMVETSGDLDFTEADSRTISYSFSPLLSWNGNFGDNISSNIAYNMSFNENTDYFRTQGSKVSSTTKQNSVNGSVSYSFKAPKGLQLPLIGDRIRFKNELTASLDVSYEDKESQTQRNDEKPSMSVDRNATKIIPSASYKFSKNIDAGLAYSYEFSYENTTDLILKSNSLSTWIEIKF